MIFIARRNQRGGQPDIDKQDRHLSFDICSANYCPPQQHRQNRILDQVRGLSNEELDLTLPSRAKYPVLNQRKKGAMIREVCSADIKSVEPKKITPNQMTIGSQYFKNDFTRRSVSFALANPQSTIFLLP